MIFVYVSFYTFDLLLGFITIMSTIGLTLWDISAVGVPFNQIKSNMFNSDN